MYKKILTFLLRQCFSLVRQYSGWPGMEEAWCKSGVRDKSQNVRIIYTHAMARDHVRLVFFFFNLKPLSLY